MSMMSPVPRGYHSIQPYLVLADCAKAMDFYARAFGATEVERVLRKDRRIGHAEMRFGDSIVMMADENPEARGPAHFGGSPASLLLYVGDCDGVFKRALKAGATPLRDPENRTFGDRMAGIRDPFGYTWWIATHIQDVALGAL